MKSITDSPCYFTPKTISNARSNLGSIGEKCVPSTSSNMTAAWLFDVSILAAARVLSSTVAILLSLAFFSFSPNSIQTFLICCDGVCFSIHSTKPSYHSDPDMLMMLVKEFVLKQVHKANNPDNETPIIVLSASSTPKFFSVLGIISLVNLSRNDVPLQMVLLFWTLLPLPKVSCRHSSWHLLLPQWKRRICQTSFPWFLQAESCSRFCWYLA